jgi:hypothetical protein
MFRRAIVLAVDPCGPIVHSITQTLDRFAV